MFEYVFCILVRSFIRLRIPNTYKIKLFFTKLFSTNILEINGSTQINSFLFSTVSYVVVRTLFVYITSVMILISFEHNIMFTLIVFKYKSLKYSDTNKNAI